MFVYVTSVAISSMFAWLAQFVKRIKDKDVPTRIVRRMGVVFFFLSFLIIFLLSGFRVDVGLDSPSYVRIFNDIYTYDFTYFEPGFRLLITTIQYFTTDPQWLFIISSLLTVGGIFISIKKFSVNPALSVFLFCTMGFLSHSFNLTRQFISIAIILYSLSFVINKQFMKYVICVVLAALFHQTALIMLPMYFLLRLKAAPAYYILITLIAGALSVFQSAIINSVVMNFYPQYYDEGLLTDRIISPYYIILCLSLLALAIYLLYKKRISMNNDESRIMVNLIYLIMLAHIFFVWVPLSNRVSLYLDITLILVIPKLLTYIESKIYRQVATMLAVLYFCYAAYSSLQDNANGVLPYKSSLFEVSLSSANERVVV